MPEVMVFTFLALSITISCRTNIWRSENGLLTTVPNPFYGIIATGTLSTPTIQLGQLLRPFPQFTSVIATNNSYGDSIYHSLQAKLERRFSNGFSFLLSYTYSKLIDDVLPSTANLGFAGETFS